MGGLLILGRSGQLARELAALAGERGTAWSSLGRSELDLADPALDLEAAVARLLAAERPALLVNAAAYTAVDRAETEREAAFRLNAALPAAAARACAAAGVPFINISTDYVFDGRGGAPYREDAPINPLNVYGESKVAGERAVVAAGGRAVTLRTSWVYAAHGRNFVRSMLALAESEAEVSVVDDQRGRPTWARSLAEAVLAAGAVLADGTLQGAPILHVTDHGEATWAELAEAVFEGSAALGGRAARVGRVFTAERRTGARRPADSRLDVGLAERSLEWRPRPWRAALADCLSEIYGVR